MRLAGLYYIILQTDQHPPASTKASPHTMVACNQHSAGRVKERQVTVSVPWGRHDQDVLSRYREHIPTFDGVPSQLRSNCKSEEVD